MDWEAWAERVGPMLWSGGPGGEFQSLFAPGATYEDPVNSATPDIDAIEQMTRSAYPDWHQEITSLHGDDRGGVFEWVGRGNLGGRTPMVIHGCTVIGLDEDERIVRWRDYFDLAEIERNLGTTIEDAVHPGHGD